MRYWNFFADFLRIEFDWVVEIFVVEVTKDTDTIIFVANMELVVEVVSWNSSKNSLTSTQ